MLRIGLIGCGSRGKYLIGNLPPEGRVVAICDCYTPRMTGTLKPEAASEYARVLSRFVEQDAARCVTYQDYRRMLDKAALDAVLIATPDHHHVLAAMLACQAGLDVYCEKPLTLTIAEGQRLIQAVRHHRRVLQVGSQQRSMEMDRFACQFVRDGKLGRVSHVDLPIWASPLRYRGLPEEPLPEGMDWESFCGPTPLRPYHWRLWQKDERNWEGKRWRGWDMWRDYSGHLVTNWGAHALDMAQWALGMDASGPVEVGPLAGGSKDDPRTCPMAARYASGVELRMIGVKGLSAGGMFYGEHGQIAIDRNRFRGPAGPHPRSSRPFRRRDLERRGHRRPAAPPELDRLHQVTRRTERAGRSRSPHGDNVPSGQPCPGTPPPHPMGSRAELIVGDDEASALLDRPRRPGWELPEIRRASFKSAGSARSSNAVRF